MAHPPALRGGAKKFGMAPRAVPATSAGVSDDYLQRFGGIGRLFGAAALPRLQAAHVCVVGVGGVGSWTVEALARWWTSTTCA